MHKGVCTILSLQRLHLVWSDLIRLIVDMTFYENLDDRTMVCLRRLEVIAVNLKFFFIFTDL